MNKKEFLQILEVKLAILSDGEKKDIINEYRDTIEEKIKHGKSEEKAIADFGDIDELIKEILSAYNINPNYHDRKKSQEIVDSCESFIKKISRVLSDFTKRLIDDFKHSNHNLSFELVFEILIKVLIFLIISALIRLPFLAVNQLGSSIIAMGFGSLDGIFQFIWGIVVVVVYLICCILIATIMFKKYFNNHLDISDSFKEKKDFKKELKSDKNNIVKNKKKNYLITDSLMIIVKVMVIIFVLIPNWFINICLYSITICVFFYLLQGINLWGLLLLMLGFSVIFTYIALIIHYVTFSFNIFLSVYYWCCFINGWWFIIYAFNF
ncbi:MAG: DUF1700 domain-containing protein [Bacilli bacterium]